MSAENSMVVKTKLPSLAMQDFTPTKVKYTTTGGKEAHSFASPNVKRKFDGADKSDKKDFTIRNEPFFELSPNNDNVKTTKLKHSTSFSVQKQLDFTNSPIPISKFQRNSVENVGAACCQEILSLFNNEGQENDDKTNDINFNSDLVTIRAKIFQLHQKSLLWEDHWWVNHPLVEVQNNKLAILQDGLYEISLDLNVAFGNVLGNIYMIVFAMKHGEMTLKSYIPFALFERGRRVYLSLSVNDCIAVLRDIKSVNNSYSTSSYNGQKVVSDKDSDSDENYSVVRMRHIVL
jgi:hypothetical protein